MNKPLQILITGDTHLGGGRVKELAISNNYQELFGEFIDIIRSSDLALTNLESPLIDDGNTIQKIGPNLKSPVKSIRVLKKVGFNLATLANNHIMDYGEQGLLATLSACKGVDIDTVGAGTNQEEATQTYNFCPQSTKISIINIAENEFGTTFENTPGAHALNLAQNYTKIREAARKADFVLVIVHGGHEGYQLPSPRMKETYRFFVEAGASAVIGHHPHCYSGYELYKEAPIFYSLGNFLFDKKGKTDSSWNQGFMVVLSIVEHKLEFEIIPYIQNSEEVGVRSLHQEEYSSFNNQLSKLNAIINNDKELHERFREFCESSRNMYSAFIEPHANKYIHALRNRNLFPSMLGRRKKRMFLNLIRCEAHRDVLLNILQE